MTPQLLTNFTANRLDLGLNLQSARNLELGEIAEGRSARFERGSGILTGPGYQFLHDLGTSAIGDGDLEAKVFPAKWVKSGTTVFVGQDPDNTIPKTIGLTLTTETKTHFIEQGNGDIFIMNTVDTNVRVAVSKNTVALAASDTTITVGTNFVDKYSASGTVYINGTAYTFSGKNATQLTGVQEGGGVVTTAQAINSLVTETSNPATFTFKGIFAFELESRQILGGRKDFENIGYASAPEDASNPAFFYDFTGNGTTSKIFKTKMVAGIAGIGAGYLFGKQEVHQLSGFDVATGGWLTTPISTQYGAYNERCVVDMDGIIAFFGNKRLIPISIQLTPEAVAAPYLDDEFDHRLRPWLDELDEDDEQGDANLFYDPVQKILKITARRNGALETRVYDRQNNAYLPPESRPRASQSMFDGKSYFVDTVGKFHKDDFGRTNGGIAIYHNWKTGRMEFDKGRQTMRLYQLEFDGFMSQAAEYTFRVYMDGNTTASFDRDFDDSSDRDFDDSSINDGTGILLGSRGIGINLVGGGEGGPRAFSFKQNILLHGISGEDVQLEWETQKEGVFFQINSFKLTAYVIRRDQRAYQ